MSELTSAWAWEQDVKQNAKLLLLFLADSCDRWGNGPDLEPLMRDAALACGFDPQTGRTHLRELEDSGLVVLHNGRYRVRSPKPERSAFRFALDKS